MDERMDGWMEFNQDNSDNSKTEISDSCVTNAVS